MYTLPLNAKDQVLSLENAPPSSPGAPCPMVLATEQTLCVIYYCFEPVDWDDSSPRSVELVSQGELFAVATFSRHRAYYQGSPNDEAFSGHPLYEKGLRPYGAYEVTHSSWVRRLMEMNRVHPSHRDEVFAGCRHFVLSFHDSVFECVAGACSFEMGRGSILEAANDVLAKWVA